MPINPEIALGVKQFEMPDPLAAYAKMATIKDAQNRNALSQLEFAKAKREEATTNALNDAYRAAYNPETGEVDYNALSNYAVKSGNGSLISGIEKTRREAEQSKLTGQKLNTEVVSGKLGLLREALGSVDQNSPDAPQQMMSVFSSAFKDPVLGGYFTSYGGSPEKTASQIANAVNSGKFSDLYSQSVLGIEKHLQNVTEQNKPSEIVQKMLNAGIDPKSPEGRQIAAADLSRDINGSPTEAGRLALDRQKFEYEKNNPGFEIKETPQGLVSVNKKTGAAQAIMLGEAAVESTQSPAFKAKVRTAEKRGELTAQAESDQAARARGAANVLTSLGYNLGNPSADDKVTSLIKKSTGGLLEAGASQIPRVIGQTTPGRLAIAELKTIANNTAMDLLGGKIGAGISNADRDFIIAGLGEIGDPGIPVEERVAAWRQVTARLARIANADKFSPATDGTAPAGGQSAPAPAKNFTYVPGKGLVPQ